MEEFMLSDDVFDQIEDFNCRKLTDEQNCKQPKASYYWCQCKFQQNFKNWTSGNNEIDKFIQKTQLEGKHYRDILEWIEYDRFENVEYLAKGGFGTIYKAIWKDGHIGEWDSENNKWKRRNFLANYLIELHIVTSSFGTFTNRCYSITKDPESNNFIMVMEYAENGSLRQILNNNIHSQGLINHDFHCGNIINGVDNYTFITDLGLCRPANVIPSQDKYKKMYGVLPYIAPEVLIGKEYTQESDIYGFGIIAYEVCTGLPPYHDIAHDKILAISICNGLRPKSDYKIPQLILDIVKQCWNADPLKRPKANELYNSLYGLYSEYDIHIDEINKQIEEAEKINEKLTSFSLPYNHGTTLSYTTNPQAVYTSRLLDFKNLPEPKNAFDNKDNDSFEYSESIEAIDFTNST
ncbi:unnamed protein product [Rhizophagus irregularis]|nr:unnamed protein product [Rhizophagus irregularis]